MRGRARAALQRRSSGGGGARRRERSCLFRPSASDILHCPPRALLPAPRHTVPGLRFWQRLKLTRRATCELSAPTRLANISEKWQSRRLVLCRSTPITTLQRRSGTGDSALGRRGTTPMISPQPLWHPVSSPSRSHQNPHQRARTERARLVHARSLLQTMQSMCVM